MKIVGILFLILLLIPLSGRSQDVLDTGLEGRVKSIELKKFRINEIFGKTEKGRLYTHIDSKFDSLGKLNEQIVYNKNGTVRKKRVYVYDKQGRLDMRKFYSGGVIFVSFETYKYDDRGYMTERKVYGKDSTLRAKILNKYDKKGNNIEKRSFYSVEKEDSISLKRTDIYSIDETGNIKKRTTTCSENAIGARAIEGAVKYKYNEKGLCLEEIIYDIDGSQKLKVSYEYKYDARGNWTEKKFYVNRKVGPTLEERIILYYD